MWSLLRCLSVDAAASHWARHEPGWIWDAFEKITNFGLSGWFLIPFAAIVLWLAALVSPALSGFAKCAHGARRPVGFLFLAIGVPGLFVAIVKRLIGRARPYVGGGGHDDPFPTCRSSWRPEYASMPSGHATTAVSAAIAIGAIWPRTRLVMWLYALIIMASRVVVLAHHPSDVIAGALTGAAGRTWCGAGSRRGDSSSARAIYVPIRDRRGSGSRPRLVRSSARLALPGTR